MLGTWERRSFSRCGQGLVWAAILAVLSAGSVFVPGCNESPAKYDPLKDSSSIYVSLSNPTEDTTKTPRLTVLLSGSGKTPKKWDAAFCVEYRNPKGEPDFWGDKGTLVFNPAAGGGRDFTEPHYVIEENPSFGDEVMFHMEIEDLLFLMEYGGKYVVNGKKFRLAPDQEAKIREAIIAAREVTNSTK